MYIPVVVGTSRENRESINPANHILDLIQEMKHIETDLIDVSDYDQTKTIPSWLDDERINKWKEIFRKASAAIFVIPEYNHGYPGEVKLLFDAVYSELNRKPVGVCGVSGGNWGGTRVVEHFKQVLTGAGAVATYNSVYFPNVSKNFDKNGSPKEDFSGRVQKFMDELIWYGKVLNEGREKYGT